MKEPLLTAVTVLGMLTDLRFEHSAKALGPILVMPSLMITVLIEFLLLYHGVSELMAHEAIFPEPDIVRVPPLSTHCALLPQVPDSPTLPPCSVI